MKAGRVDSYPTVPTLSNSSTGQPQSATRKLPPPFDPKQINTSLPGKFNSMSFNNPPPEKRRPMSVVSASSQTSNGKKAAPPVKRKPVHLSSNINSPATSTGARSEAGSPVLSRTQAAFPPPPRRMTEGGLPAMPPPRRSGRGAGAPREDEGPSLPPRPVDLLADDEASLEGWETLRPS
jgi:hypothetical protein